jgi:hypothetical protein
MAVRHIPGGQLTHTSEESLVVYEGEKNLVADVNPRTNTGTNKRHKPSPAVTIAPSFSDDDLILDLTHSIIQSQIHGRAENPR